MRPSKRSPRAQEKVPWKSLWDKFYTPIKSPSQRKHTLKDAQLSGFYLDVAERLFLRENKEKIGSFADIGCALPLGAPQTLDARSILERRVKVFAVDVVGDFSNPSLLERHVIPVKHSIVKSPLKQKVDAIRFRGVAKYLTQSERRRALVNIYKSLIDGGYLIGPGIILQKSQRQKGFVLVETFKRGWDAP